MSAAVVDASVAIKWFVPQPLTEAAERAWRDHELTAPALIYAEIGNALWKYVRAGHLGEDKALAVFDLLKKPYFITEPLDEALSREAADISFKIDHPVYDCYYLALSQAQGAPLITDDRRLSSKARAAGFSIVELSAAQ
jgi:predicted nucleic acid-binding protein